MYVAKTFFLLLFAHNFMSLYTEIETTKLKRSKHKLPMFTGESVAMTKCALIIPSARCVMHNIYILIH